MGDNISKSNLVLLIQFCKRTGYNFALDYKSLFLGGRGKMNYTKEDKEKMSKAAKGRRFTKETLRKNIM